MANVNLYTRFKNKIDTESNWEANNPILLNGEIALVRTSTGINIKIGDGTSNYNDLPFVVTANKSNIYVSPNEPAEASDYDIWIDTSIFNISNADITSY